MIKKIYISSISEGFTFSYRKLLQIKSKLRNFRAFRTRTGSRFCVFSVKEGKSVVIGIIRAQRVISARKDGKSIITHHGRLLRYKFTKLSDQFYDDKLDNLPLEILKSLHHHEEESDFEKSSKTVFLWFHSCILFHNDLHDSR